MTVSVEIEPLGPRHDRKSFDCGVAALDRYFKELAPQGVKRRVSHCFVACAEGGEIVGFYTFAATSLPLTELTPEEARRLTRYPVMPAGLIGRLAVERRFVGAHIGSSLIMDAVQRASRSDPAIYALVVDAKDQAAVSFYEHLGFRRFLSRSMSLFLPIATALEALHPKG